VDENRLRFDFSHFAKMTDEEISEVEQIVNDKIRENIPRTEKRDVPIDDALEMGATALFGEKYGEKVRVITFDPGYSVELCGGTHVNATGQIGLFKIVSEGAIAAGVRRVEAVTGKGAEDFVNDQIDVLKNIKEQFKNQANTLQAVQQTLEQNKKLEKELEKLMKEKALQESEDLFKNAEEIHGVKFIKQKVNLDVKQAKDLAYKLRAMGEKVFIVFALENGGKVNLVVALSDQLIEDGMNAGNIIKQVARHIQGGGGGQPHMATAGGKDASGIEGAFQEARKLLG
jgi:alanyl-tRNA synthetase